MLTETFVKNESENTGCLVVTDSTSGKSIWQEPNTKLLSVMRITSVQQDFCFHFSVPNPEIIALFIICCLRPFLIPLKSYANVAVL